MSIGENIRDIRKSRNMSQGELGKLLGVSQAMIAQYENGNRKPKIGTLAKIAEALNVFIGELDANWGTDILNSQEDYEKTKKLLSKIEADTERKIQREERNLLDDYWRLNNSGRSEARKRVKELTELPKYVYTPSTPGEAPESKQ